jgi:hypothetical protein
MHIKTISFYIGGGHSKTPKLFIKNLKTLLSQKNVNLKNFKEFLKYLLILKRWGGVKLFFFNFVLTWVNFWGNSK